MIVLSSPAIFAFPKTLDADLLQYLLPKDGHDLRVDFKRAEGSTLLLSITQAEAEAEDALWNVKVTGISPFTALSMPATEEMTVHTTEEHNQTAGEVIALLDSFALPWRALALWRRDRPHYIGLEWCEHKRKIWKP